MRTDQGHMRWQGVGWLLVGLLLPALASAGEANLPPAPSLAEVEATWRALVEALSLGDREGVRQLTHSARRSQLPDPLPMTPGEAYQFGFCRPQPAPLRIGPEEVVYPLLCEHGAERVDHFFHLRRDRDGVWRVLAF